MNLCELSKEQQAQIELDKKAHYMLKTMDRETIVKHLDSLDSSSRKKLADTLNGIKGL